MNCVEEHDTCLTTAITSSQHLRGAAKPISTLQFGEDTWPILETGLSQRCSLPPKEIVFGAARWALAAARGMLPRPTTDSPPQRQRYPKRYRFLTLLPRTRDASTIEQRRVFVSVAALYSMRCLTACGRVILGCSGGSER